MKRYLFLPLLLLFTGLILTSCNKESLTSSENEFSEVQLKAGTWTVTQVALNQFDSEGYLVSTNIIPFGEGEQGGICTFTYDSNHQFTMVDNGTVFTSKYNLDGRLLNMDNGDEWGIREMSDTHLEVALRGDEVNNPCNYSVSGAVYTLTRNDL